MHNLSDSKIRDCIGKDRYYNIEKGKADLPLKTAIRLFKLCNMSDTEKLWFLDPDAKDYPMPKNILNEIRDLRSAVDRQQAENKYTQPSRTPESSTQEKAGEKRIRVQPKKPHPS
jgi:hypothetical protein